MGELDDVRRGDPEARERWVAAWWPRVYRMALAMTGRDADAEDLAQETLMAGLASIDRFRGEASEGTWLYAILLRKQLSERRRPPALPRRAAATPQEPEVEDALALLSALKPALRITAALYYVEDLSVGEIARALGVARPTVRWRLFRIRRILRREIEGAGGAVCKEVL